MLIAFTYFTHHYTKNQILVHGISAFGTRALKEIVLKSRARYNVPDERRNFSVPDNYWA